MSDSFSRYAPVILRLGMGAVVAWFGFSQLTNPTLWTGIVPAWATSLSGMSALTIVYSNGVFEVIAAALLLFGAWVRPVAFLLAGHLVVIALGFGLSPIGVRDFGLSAGLLSVCLYGYDVASVGYKREIGI